MTEHTLAALAGIFILLDFAVALGLTMGDEQETTSGKIARSLFTIPESVFVIWLILTILF